jgi:exodeoxyribonuclease VII large subunit
MPPMSDTATVLQSGHNLPALTVSEISQAVKRTLESNFERVRVRGEVSKPNYHGSGHLYFSLKDENAAIDAVCWRSAVARRRRKVEHGMEGIVSRGNYPYPRTSK